MWNKFVFSHDNYLNFSYPFKLFFYGNKHDENTCGLQECFKEQEALIPLEQAARQKVAELKSVMDSEKSQGSVLKAILQAKESNLIGGIYGRMGDLGAIDGQYFASDGALSQQAFAIRSFFILWFLNAQVQLINYNRSDPWLCSESLS